jgi:hypothetical protein
MIVSGFYPEKLFTVLRNSFGALSTVHLLFLAGQERRPASVS